MLKKLASDTLIAFIANIIYRLTHSIIVIILANYLGPEKYGMYATAIAFISIFLLFKDLGTRSFLIQEVSKEKKNASIYFGNIALIQIIITVIIYPLIIIIAKIFNYPELTFALIAVLGLAQLIWELRNPATATLRAFLRNKTISIFEAIQGILFIIFFFIIIKLVTSEDIGLIKIAWSQVYINLALVIALFIYVSKKIVLPRLKVSKVLYILKNSAVFGLSEVFFVLYFQIDQVVISLLRDPREVAIYSVPFKLVVFFLFIPRILYNIMRPIMYRLYKTNIKKYKRVHYFLYRYDAAIGIPAAIALVILAKPIIHLLFKSSYDESILVLQIFGLFLIPRFVAAASNRALTTTFNQKTKTKIQIPLLILNLVLDIILVYKYGYMGAVAATMFVEICLCIFYIYFAQKYLNEKISEKIIQILPVIAASAVMGIFIYLIRNYNVVIVSILGLIVYVLALYIFRFFKEYDIRLIKQIIKRKKITT